MTIFAAMNREQSTSFDERARALDASDALRSFRDQFHFPQKNGRPALYFCGNSLGLQPLRTQELVDTELEEWRTHGVEGHFAARHPWFSYHRIVTDQLAALVGAAPHEVVAMNTLTVNLHLMMISFYRPTAERFKIILAGSEFPSDRYAIESQVRLHGFDPEHAMIEIEPFPGTSTLTTEQVVAAIREHGPSTALVLFSGVHFFTGQRFDMPSITQAARAVGANVGFDLAHAIGNVQLDLHAWDVDFAVWCSYKYLNAGPGAVAGAFVHERHAKKPDLPRLAGWWGNDEKTRFTMEHRFDPTYGADGWQLSNAQILPLAALKASLDLFQEAGMERLSEKRDRLTAFAEEVIDDAIGMRTDVRIITPRDPMQRGAQLSVMFDTNGKHIFDTLGEHGVVVDWRTPNVIRITPAPMYNSFADVAAFGSIFRSVLGTPV
jgi:kynureninase